MKLETLVDFPDDALATVIDHARVDAMMRKLKELGVTRVTWSYYGDGHGGMLLPAGYNERWTNYAKTLETLGNPLKVAVEAAHRHGLECYAYFKPYETGPGCAFPEGSPEAAEYGLIPQKGGSLCWQEPFVVKNPHLRIRHRPDDSIEDLSQIPVCSIKLRKRDDSPTRIKRENLQIWVSDNNYQYRQLDVEFTLTESVEPASEQVVDIKGNVVTKEGALVRTLTLSGFHSSPVAGIGDPGRPGVIDPGYSLIAPYILVTTDFTDGPSDFENTGEELLQVFDDKGNEIPGVFSFSGRPLWEASRNDFRNWGLLFDMGDFGAPTLRLDEDNRSGRAGYVAFARGRNEYLPGALCETEPEVQAFWMSCLEEIVDAGADGVDFRVENHSTHTDFPEEYGFNDVVLERCSAVAGIADPGPGSTTPATEDAVDQVRGDAYTEFLRNAKQYLTGHGKRMRINLNIDAFRPWHEIKGDRKLAYSANIAYQWQRWVDEGLMDEAIMRMYRLPMSDIWDDPLGRDMTARCEAKGIPMTVNRYINPDYPAEFERVRDDGRFSGFILYETANFLRFGEEAECTVASDVVAEVCKQAK